MRDDYVVLTANKFTLEHLQLSEIFIYICIWIWVYWWNAKFLEKLLLIELNNNIPNIFGLVSGKLAGKFP